MMNIKQLFENDCLPLDSGSSFIKCQLLFYSGDKVMIPCHNINTKQVFFDETNIKLQVDYDFDFKLSVKIRHFQQDYL